MKNPNNQVVFKSLDKLTAKEFRNFQENINDIFNGSVEEITSLPTLLAQALRYLIPDGAETPNNKQTLIQTIKSWQKILHKTLGALSQAQQG